MESATFPPEVAKPTFDREPLDRLRVLLSEPRNSKFLGKLVVINIFILFCRPQFTLPVIAMAGIPLLLSVYPLFSTLGSFGRLWKFGRIPRAMLALIVIGIIWTPLARNNFWAFQTTRDLIQQDFCYLFPVMLFMSFGNRIRNLVTCSCFAAFYLGLHSLTHAGYGPGGFLGDENDLCLQIDALLGIPVLLLLARNSFGKKVGLFVVILVALGGIVLTWSRGGFLGMMAVMGYMFWQTPRKVAALILAAVVVLCGLAAVPKSYWKEMETISDTKESTAKGRIDIWKIGVRIWMDPKNFLWGVGMQNTPYYLAEYEPDENKAASGKSTGGRAVHSSYVQLVADLGLAGLLIFSTCMIGTLNQNRRLLKRIRLERARTRQYSTVLDALIRAPKKIDPNEPPPETRLEEIQMTFQRLLGEFEYISAVLWGINSCLIGGLTAGAFVSAVYYPTLWYLVAFGMAVRVYMDRVFMEMYRIREAHIFQVPDLAPRPGQR